jgi:hypothetical protein
VAAVEGTWRKWPSAEVAVSLMREMMVDLELTRQAASKRVPEAGAPIPAVVGDEGEDEEGETAFASDDDQLSQVLDAARLYASGNDEELAGSCSLSSRTASR